MKRIEMSPLSIIVAVDTDGGFGKDGKIPWNIPEDMKHFQTVTKGAICIMGRKTYEDMLEMNKKRKKKKSKIKKILPGRESYVVTSNKDYVAEGASVVSGIREVIQLMEKDDSREVIILGGYRMFVEALTWADKIHMTIIKGDPYNCDVFFPIASLNNFKLTEGKETDRLYFATYTR